MNPVLDRNDLRGPPRRLDPGRVINAIGLGVIIAWAVGAMVAGLSLAVGLIGVALIILSGQGLRALFRLRPEGLWFFVGGVIGVSGVWHLNRVETPLVPFLFIILGTASIVALLRKTEASSH